MVVDCSLRVCRNRMKMSLPFSFFFREAATSPWVAFSGSPWVASSQSLRFILSLRLYSIFIASRPGLMIWFIIFISALEQMPSHELISTS